MYPSDFHWTDCRKILDFSLRFIRTSRFRFKSHRNNTLYIMTRQSHWPRGLRRGSAPARLLGFWVRIPLDAWISVCCDCCVLSGRGLWVGLITRPEESYRLWCVVVCDLETSWMRRPCPIGDCCTKNALYLMTHIYVWSLTTTVACVSGTDSFCVKKKRLCRRKSRLWSRKRCYTSWGWRKTEWRTWL
jgi:hypothetical protein